MELTNLQGLLDEELTADETRDLLERLGEQEFGGSENPTVGSIVEATGSDAVTVGRLLAEIRNEDFGEQFGLQLKNHGQRIETLEERTKMADSHPDSIIGEAFTQSYLEQKEKERLVNDKLQRKALAMAGYVFLVLLVLIAILAMIAIGATPPASR